MRIVAKVYHFRHFSTAKSLTNNSFCVGMNEESNLPLLKHGQTVLGLGSFVMTQEEWIARLKKIAQESKCLTGDLLVALDSLFQSAMFTYQHPSLVQRYGSAAPTILAEIQEAQKRRALRDAERYLRLKKYVEVSGKGDQIIGLTQTGRARALEICMSKITKELPEKRYCVATFDIPEDTRVTRWQIRRRLRAIGFEQYQLSVWITKKDICDEMAEYIQLIGAEKWVMIFRAEKKIGE